MNVNEHRASTDQNIEQKTEQTEKRITPLENCNALSDKIAMDIAMLAQELARIKVGQSMS